jgi:ABC-type lipoprotein release transport system permease subunit
MLLLRLGYRNLWRNRRRTLLTMGAMSLSVAVLIVTLGIYSGMMWDMLESATTTYRGQAEVTAPGYAKHREVDLSLAQDPGAMGLRADPEVAGVAGRVRGFALLSFGSGVSAQTQPAEILGVDPSEERGVTVLDRKVVAGRFISDPSADGMVLGRGLARRLTATLGGEIVVMGQGAEGSIAAGVFHVVGIVDTGDSVRDAALAITGRAALQQMLGLPGRIHEWAITLHHPLTANVWAAAAAKKLPGVEVRPWQAYLSQVAAAMDMWGAFDWIYSMIFYFAVILICVNTLYMAFFERMREFAIMEAVGLKPARLSHLILLEGLLMAGLSALIGGAVGAAGSWLLYFHPWDLSAVLGNIHISGAIIQPRIHTYPTLHNVLQPIATLVVLGTAVAWFPARRLRQLRPTEALRSI